MATQAMRGAVVLAMALTALHVTAQTVQDASLRQLERAFWRCDHAATQGALDSGSAMDCSFNFEAFKARRFGGDFAALLAWWHANKDVEHSALAAEARRLASAAVR